MKTFFSFHSTSFIFSLSVPAPLLFSASFPDSLLSFSFLCSLYLLLLVSLPSLISILPLSLLLCFLCALPLFCHQLSYFSLPLLPSISPSLLSFEMQVTFFLSLLSLTLDSFRSPPLLPNFFSLSFFLHLSSPTVSLIFLHWSLALPPVNPLSSSSCLSFPFSSIFLFLHNFPYFILQYYSF